MNRFERVSEIIKGEKITLENVELYKELLEEVTDEAFEAHIDALKDFASSGEVYILKTSQNDEGVISVETVNKTTGETSAEVKPEAKQEQAPAVEELKSTPEVKPEAPAAEVKPEVKQDEAKAEAKTDAMIEKKDETKPEANVLQTSIEAIQAQMAKLFEAVTKSNTQAEALSATFKAQFEELSKSIVPLKRKIKDLEDGQFSVSKKLPVDRIRKSIDDVVAPESGVEMFKSVFPVEMQGDVINFNKVEEADEASDDE